MIEEVKSYKTSDGRLFYTKKDAELHIEMLSAKKNVIKSINNLLKIENIKFALEYRQIQQLIDIKREL